MKHFVGISTLLVNTAILFILGTFYLETRPEKFLLETPDQVETMPSEEQADEMDTARQELLDKLSESGLGNVRVIVDEGKIVIEDANATIEQLKETARKTNAASNYVDFILQEYKDYYSENYRYDFVQKAVAPSHDAYVRVSNDLRSIRNEAFMRIGSILEEQGRIEEAFFYFRDAYRLSSFDDYTKKDPGTRYLAEQRMKDILGLDDIKSFTSWR